MIEIELNIVSKKESLFQHPETGEVTRGWQIELHPVSADLTQAEAVPSVILLTTLFADTAAAYVVGKTTRIVVSGAAPQIALPKGVRN